mgnify:CR=1 FL=1
MFCQGDQSQCNTGKDSIKVIINEGKPNSKVYTVDFNNIGQQKVWQKKSFLFNSADSRIDVKNNLFKLVFFE